MLLKSERKEGIALPAENQQSVQQQMPLPPPPKREAERQIRLQPRSQAMRQSPPLFIKLEKYSDVVRNVQELQAYAAEMRRTVDMLVETEQRLHRGIEGAYNALEGLNDRLSTLTKRLAGEQQEGQKPMNVQKASELTGYVKDVHGELDKIMSDLENIR